MMDLRLSLGLQTLLTQASKQTLCEKEAVLGTFNQKIRSSIVLVLMGFKIYFVKTSLAFCSNKIVLNLFPSSDS